MRLLHAVFLTVICLALFAETAVPADATGWRKRMQELASVLPQMLTVSESSRKLDAASTAKLEDAAEKMAALAHDLKSASGKLAATPPPEGDPSLALIAGSFEREARQAQKALKAGHTEYARQTLRALAVYCVACHTRHDGGPDFPSLEISPKMGSLSSFEKAELLAALRNFDGALKEFDLAIGDAKWASEHQLDWNRAVRSALAVAVRAKRSPDQALKVIDRALSMPNLPTYLTDKMGAWKKSLNEWKKEPSKGPATEESLYAEALRLTEAAKSLQKYALDHSADILYLRASLAAHEQLSRFPNGKRASSALLLLGNASSLVEDPLMLPMPKLFYEACVRRSPHSSTAHECFVRLEEDTYFGYTGSGGTRIPADVVEQLKELRALSAPKRK